MNVIDNLFRKFGYQRATYNMPVENYTPDFGIYAAGTHNVTHKNALTFTGAFSAISTKAENLASLPKQVFETTPNGKREDKKHPVYSLIHFQPNPMMNDFVFWEKIEADVAGWGNSVVVIEANGGGVPKHLWPVEPSNFNIKKVDGQLYYTIPTGDFAGTYHSSQILHFKYFTLDGIMGVDPISLAAQAIGIGLNGQTFAAEYFEKKGALRGVFEMEGELGEAAFKRVTERLSKQKNHATPLLENGIKYKNISVSPDAAQAIQSRIFSIQDAARIWKVPVSLLAENSHSTFSNTEQQDIQFVKYGLRPECKRFETECETKLFSGAEREVYSVKFDLKGLLRGDLKTQALFYHYGILDGWMTRNEVRGHENMNPIDGLDEPLVPVNMTTPDALENALKDEQQPSK